MKFLTKCSQMILLFLLYYKYLFSQSDWRIKINLFDSIFKIDLRNWNVTTAVGDDSRSRKPCFTPYICCCIWYPTLVFLFDLFCLYFSSVVIFCIWFMSLLGGTFPVKLCYVLWSRIKAYISLINRLRNMKMRV